MAMLFSYALAHTIALVILVRLVHGLGWGFSGTSTATIAAGIIPRERFDLGMGLGVIALGSIAALYGYRNMYWFTLLPVIFAVLFYLVFMRRR